MKVCEGSHICNLAPNQKCNIHGNSLFASKTNLHNCPLFGWCHLCWFHFPYHVVWDGKTCLESCLEFFLLKNIDVGFFYLSVPDKHTRETLTWAPPPKALCKLPHISEQFKKCSCNLFPVSCSQLWSGLWSLFWTFQDTENHAEGFAGILIHP